MKRIRLKLNKFEDREKLILVGVVNSFAIVKVVKWRLNKQSISLVKHKIRNILKL